MNWQIEGKKPRGKRTIRLTVVGGPDAEDALRAHIEGSHPGFQIESVTQLDGALKPVETDPPTKEQSDGPRNVSSPLK